MNLIASLNLISILTYLIAVRFLFKIKVLSSNTKLIALFLVIFAISYNACLFGEWSGVSDKFDVAEDIIGALVLVWFFFILYTLLQNIAEQRLFDSKEKYKRLINNIPGVVFTCEFEKNWTMHYLSDEILTLSGYQASDFVGESKIGYASIIYPDDRQMVWDKILSMSNSDLPYSLDYRIVHKDGSIRWVNENGKAQRTKGQNTTLEGVIIDITKRKWAQESLQALNQQLMAQDQQLRAANQQLVATEQQLKASNQQLKASNQQLEATEQQLRVSNRQLSEQQRSLWEIIQKTPIPSFVIDTDHTIKYWNKACESLTVYPYPLSIPILPFFKM